MSLDELDVRTLILTSYDIPKYFYQTGIRRYAKGKIHSRSAAYHVEQLGTLCWYGDRNSHTGRKRRKRVDIDLMVAKWKKAVVGLAVAHDKAEADNFEASIEDCLVPILSAPVSQLRDFAVKLLKALKTDPAVPFLVWRSYEIWVDMMKNAPDGDIKELKTDLAKEIVDMVEDDAKRDLPTAMIRALQWRSPEQLEEMKKVVTKEKSKGRSVRLKGRESCLFLEAGGTEDEPAVRVQV